MRVKIERCLAVLKSRDFTRKSDAKKVSAFNGQDIGSTEELGNDLGCFGHPRSMI